MQSEATVYLCKCIAHCFSFFSLEDVAVLAPLTVVVLTLSAGQSICLSLGEV